MPSQDVEQRLGSTLETTRLLVRTTTAVTDDLPKAVVCPEVPAHEGRMTEVELIWTSCRYLTIYCDRVAMYISSSIRLHQNKLLFVQTITLHEAYHRSECMPRNCVWLMPTPRWASWFRRSSMTALCLNAKLSISATIRPMQTMTGPATASKSFPLLL